MKTLLGMLSLLVAAPAGAQQASPPSPPTVGPLPIAAIPRSGTVDVGLQLSGIPPLAPMTMRASPGPRCFVAHQRGTFGGHGIAYDSVLAETVLDDGAGHRLASVFSTSYVARNAGADRPVLFAFNGGPGGAAVLLNLTSLGPRRLHGLTRRALGDPANRLEDNPQSPLQVADLVFIDPVDTGFSRAADGEQARFHSVDADSEAMTQVILDWLRVHGRTASPTYLLGESYGTMRVVALARDLERSEAHVVVAGIALAGPAITFGQYGRAPNPMLVASKLPMMASLAWHYGLIDRTQGWSQAVDRARRFMRDRYIGALMMGQTIDPATFDGIARDLPAIIGIPERYFREHRTIAVGNFNAELLRDRGLVLDRNNGLETDAARPAPAPAAAASAAPAAPARSPYDEFAAAYAAVTDGFTGYVAGELHATGLPPYHLLDPAAFAPRYWTMTTTGAPALDVTLARLASAHPALKLLVLQGRYDTLTDLGTTEFVLGQTDIAPGRFRWAWYDGGHALAPAEEALGPLRAFLR